MPRLTSMLFVVMVTLRARFAQNEFEHGSVERGRSVFEGLMASYPKRLDLWNVYLDKEIKAGDLRASRNLFERLVRKRKRAQPNFGTIQGSLLSKPLFPTTPTCPKLCIEIRRLSASFVYFFRAQNLCKDSGKWMSNYRALNFGNETPFFSEWAKLASIRLTLAFHVLVLY